MQKTVLLFLFCGLSIITFAQASDFITVRKRNGRTVKTFFPGVSISFITFDKREASGLISAIRNDSVFVKEWDVRPAINSLGIPVTDTAGVYVNGFNYKEIDKVDVSDRMHFQQVTVGRLLIIGGAGYITLNLINGAAQHESVTSSKNVTSLGIAAGAIAAGLLANYIVKHRHHYHVEYIHMNGGKKPF